MYIGLKNIQQLFLEYENLLSNSDYNYCLTGFSSLVHTPTPYNHHILYVCEYTETLKNFCFLPHMSVLCIVHNDVDLETIVEDFSSINILFIATTQIHLIHIKLQNYFNTQCGISLFGNTLLDILTSEGGVQAMVDYSIKAFNNPILIFDANFNIIAGNIDEIKKVTESHDLIENRIFSDKEFQMINSRNHIHERVRKSEIPILSYNEAICTEQLLYSINTRKDIGHIVITASNRPFDSTDIEFLKILKNYINEQLKKDEFIHNSKGFNYEYFVKDLLDGKISTDKPLFNHMNYVSNEFYGNIYCLVIDPSRNSCTLNTTRIRNIFEKYYSNCKSILYKGELLIILTKPKNQYLNSNDLSIISNICIENNLYAGLSNCFQNIFELKEYYSQALSSIELGICQKNEPYLFTYEKLYLEHILKIFLQKESLETFCHPKMKLLIDYDKKYNSELAYTLYMYLINERNIAASSAAMMMHRTSLVYRFKKIHSLIGDNFDDYKERQYLILSYEINKV